MIGVLQSDKIDTTQWEELSFKSSVSSFFQSKACYDAYAQLSFLEPFLFGVEEQGKLVGVACGYLIADGGAAKRFFSRRAIIPGGLLLDNDISNDALSALLKALPQKLSSKGAIYIEIRNYHDFSQYRESITHTGFNYLPHLNIHVQTSDNEIAFTKLSITKQRQVKQSLKAGAICELSKDNEEMKAFYKLLAKLYNSKIKKPLFPFEFFDKLLQQAFTSFFVVKKDNQVLGGIFCVQSNTVLYEWFICGVDNKYEKIYPSVLATWRAIEYAALNEFEYFDFMGAGRIEEPYGVREFKLKFGGRLLEQGRFLYICKPKLYNFSKSVLNLRKKLLTK